MTKCETFGLCFYRKGTFVKTNLFWCFAASKDDKTTIIALCEREKHHNHTCTYRIETMEERKINKQQRTVNSTNQGTFGSEATVGKCQYAYSSHLKRREVIHTGVKPHQCKCCDKHFKGSSDCKRHELTHTGVKPYQCKHCDKCFSQLSNCKRHELVHAGVRPYQCKCCDKCFSSSSHCKQHELIHRGIKSYQCK